MALLRRLVSSTVSTSGSFSSESVLWSTVGDFCCHREDEVFLHGGITGNPVPPFACQFSPVVSDSHLLAVADEEGSLRLLNSRKPATQSLIKDLATHTNAVFDIAWKPGGEHIMTASGDTTIGQWDVVRGESVATYRSHTGSVKSIDVKRDEPTMLVSGGRDGSVYVWDTRCSSRGSRHRPVNHIRMAHRWARTSPPAKKKRRSVTNNLQHTDSKYGVTSVLFHGLHKVASCGAADGSVKLWDLRRTYSICRNEPPLSWHSFSPTGEPGRRFGFTALVSDPWQSSLFASCTNDIIYQYSTSMLKPDPVGAYGGHTSSTFYVKLAISPEGKFLLSGSSCSRAFIWHIDEPQKPPTVLSGHSKEVTAVCWSPALAEIVTCSDNNDLRIWRVTRNRSGIQDFVGVAEVYRGEGHSKARQALEKKSGAATTMGMTKNPSTLSTTTSVKTLLENLPSGARRIENHVGSSRQEKIRISGAPPCKALQLRNEKDM